MNNNSSSATPLTDEISKVSSIRLCGTDVVKLEVLKRRFGYRNNVDMLRYLITTAVENVFREEKYMMMLMNNNNNNSKLNIHDEQDKKKEDEMPITGASTTRPYC